MPVHVLLATYNGARFLPRLLDSIRGQEDSEWIMLARDDGSVDGTRDLLEAYAATDRRIHIVRDALGKLGSTRNFARLCELAAARGARYFAFCDQDDVWHPDKLATLRALTHDAELRGGADLPLLAFSDLRVLDAAGAVRADSYLRHAGVRLKRADRYYWLIAHNVIPGCATLGNRALLEAALPIPPAAAFHDWWFALCAAATGSVLSTDRSLVDYRVHDANVVGVKSLRARVFEYLRHPGARFADEDAKFRVAERQARALAARLRRLGIRNRFAAVLERYLAVLLAPQALRRVMGVLAGPVRRIGLARNVLMLHQLIRLCRTNRRD